jgi:hypothetical protein
VIDHIVLDSGVNLGADEDTSITQVAVLTDDALQSHGSSLFRLLAARRFTGQEGADVYAVAAAQALFVPADILGYIQCVGSAEATGEKPAPAHRRTPGIQDFIQDALNLFNVSLDI